MQRGGRGRGVIRTLAFDPSFKLPEGLNIRAVTIFVSIFLSIFSLCHLAPSMLEVFAGELNTTTSCGVGGGGGIRTLAFDPSF